MKSILRPLAAAAAVVCLALAALPAAAQTTSITCSHAGASAPFASATIFWQAIVPAREGTDLGQLSGMPAQATITAGVCGSLTVADALESAPNTCYAVTVIDNVSGKTLLGAGLAADGHVTEGGAYGCVQPTGTTWNFDDYQPPASPPVIYDPVAGPAGPAGPTGPAGADGSGVSGLTTGYYTLATSATTLGKGSIDWGVSTADVLSILGTADGSSQVFIEGLGGVRLESSLIDLSSFSDTSGTINESAETVNIGSLGDSSGAVNITGPTVSITGGQINIGGFDYGPVNIGGSNSGPVTMNGTLTLSTITGLTQCLHVNSAGLITGTGSDCGSGGMVYPSAGVPNSTGSAWGTSYTVGTGDYDLVQLTSSGLLPAISGANLTAVPSTTSLYPTLNQSTTGNAATATAATTASNLAGTTTNTIPYQSGSATTGYISPVDSAVVVTNSSGAPSESATLPAVSGLNLTALPTNTSLYPTLNQSTTGNAATATTATTATSSATATNLAGSTTDSIPYQSGSGTTGYISPVNSAVVVTNSSGVPSESATLPAVSGTNLTALPTNTSLYPTLNQSTTGNAATATAATSSTNLAGSTTDSVPYQSGSGATGYISPVNSAVVVTNSSGVPSESATLPAVSGVNLTALPTNISLYPTLNQATTGNATTATTATNFSGTTTHSIPYQSASATTSYISPVNSAVVVTNSSGVPSESTTLPAVSGASLTALPTTTSYYPTLNQNTTGTAANLSGTPALPNGTTATTQSSGDNSTKLATTAFVTTAVAGAGGGSGNMSASGTWVAGDLAAASSTNGQSQVDSGLNYGTTTGLVAPQQTTPDVVCLRPGSGATNPTYSWCYSAPLAPTTSQLTFVPPNVAPTAGQILVNSAPSSGTVTQSWYGPFTSVLTANQTTTSSTAASLGLALPVIPGSTTTAGSCTLRYESSSTSDAVVLYLNTSAASTGFWINGSQRRTTTSAVVNLLPISAAVTTATSTAILASATVATATTFYQVNVDFSLSTASATPETITVYGSIASAGTLTLGAGSSCSWKP